MSDFHGCQEIVDRLSFISDLNASKRRYEKGESLTSDQAREKLLGKYIKMKKSEQNCERG